MNPKMFALALASQLFSIDGFAQSLNPSILEENSAPNIAQNSAETPRPGRYSGRTASGESCTIDILGASTRTTKDGDSELLISAQPIDLKAKDSFESMRLGPARSKADGSLVAGLWQGQRTDRLKENLASAIQLELDTNGGPTLFRYTSNIYPSAPIVRHRFDSDSGTWIAPPYIEIECEQLQWTRPL
jgi:hypothetical protein